MHCQVPWNATSSYVPEDFIKLFPRSFEVEVSGKRRVAGGEGRAGSIEWHNGWHCQQFVQVFPESVCLLSDWIGRPLESN